jgi:hypothetical protein
MNNTWQIKWDRLKEINTLFRMFDVGGEVYFMDSGTGTPYRLFVHDAEDDLNKASSCVSSSFATIEELEQEAHRIITERQISI